MNSCLSITHAHELQHSNCSVHKQLSGEVVKTFTIIYYYLGTLRTAKGKNVHKCRTTLDISICE